MDKLTEYEECVDLSQFYEIYCSKDSGVIDGNLNGWVVIFGMLAIWGIVAALIKEGKKKPR